LPLIGARPRRDTDKKRTVATCVASAVVVRFPAKQHDRRRELCEVRVKTRRPKTCPRTSRYPCSGRRAR
jgi:hypothetical protein